MSKWLTFTNALAFIAFLALVDLCLLVRWLWRRRKLNALRQSSIHKPAPSLLNLPDESLAVGTEETHIIILESQTEPQKVAEFETPAENLLQREIEHSESLSQTEAEDSEPILGGSEPEIPDSEPSPIVIDEKAEQQLWKGLRNAPKPSRAAYKRIGKTPVIPVEKNLAAHEKLQKISVGLRTVNGVHGSAFLSSSCALLASSPALAPGSESSYPTAISMYTIGKRIVQELGRDSLEHIMIRGDQGFVLFERVLEDVVLIVVIQEDALLGSVVNEAKRAADSAADALLA